MTRPNHARAPKGACRNRRRSQGERTPAWIRPFRRVQRAIRTSAGLIASCLATADRSALCAQRHPIRSSLELHAAGRRLARASERLSRAIHELAATNDCLGREPGVATVAPQLMVNAAERWILTARCLQVAADEVFTLHEDVLEGLASGALVPERSAFHRPRIILAPLLAPVRAFLRARLPRVADRISPLLRRRRRTPRPAALSVPPRTCQGRAPPLSPVCSL